MLGRLVNDAISRHGFAYPWGNTLPVLHRADRFLINLECALTSKHERWRYPDGKEKAFYFRSDPAAVETLRIGRVDFAGLANNHIGDFGIPGLQETLSVLDRAGIAHAGAGRDLAEARAPASVTVMDWRINILAFADHPPEWAASDASPGINYSPIATDHTVFAPIDQMVAAARQGADMIIVCFHWGPNMRDRPTETFVRFARRVIEAGADIFWGHSAHVVQGIEIWHGKVILYDTGDFVDDYAVDPVLRNDLSALFVVQVRPPVIEQVRVIPVHIDRLQVNLATGLERDWVLRRISARSAEFGTVFQSDAEQLRLNIA